MKPKIWIWFTAVFAVFAGVAIALELATEHNYKKSILSSRLEGYADIVSKTTDYSLTLSLLPQNIRLTVIRPDGSVIFDSYETADSLSNHLSRPEIAECLKSGSGCSIRKSDTAGFEYIYFAHNYNGTIVRTALPFELNEKRFLLPDYMVLITLLLFFVAAAIAILFLTRRFSNDAQKDTAALLQSQKKLMTNNIAHELRTPVTSIRGYLETIVDNPSLPQDTRLLFTKRAYAQTLRLSELIRDISLITKIEEAPEMLSKEHLGIRKITDEVFDEFESAIKEKQIQVENYIAEGTSLKGNQTLVYAIFRNLVENSIKYGGEGITIRLSCRSNADGSLSFSYSDTGAGVSEEYLSKIFTRFYRIPKEESSRSEGSGLGLSIVKNAVAFHGGNIYALPLKPQGLEFCFTLK